jgi:hypothetical protein
MAVASLLNIVPWIEDSLYPAKRTLVLKLNHNYPKA